MFDSVIEVCGLFWKGVRLFDKYFVDMICWFVDRECFRVVN